MNTTTRTVISAALISLAVTLTPTTADATTRPHPFPTLCTGKPLPPGKHCYRISPIERPHNIWRYFAAHRA